MMPNLGQGGGMAIEDALVLGQERPRPNPNPNPNPDPNPNPNPNAHSNPEASPHLGQELRRDVLLRGGPAVPLALGRYQQNRVLRAAAVQASRLLIACRSSGSP